MEIINNSNRLVTGKKDGTSKYIPFVLGGHSYLGQLGNDEANSYKEQVEIVNSCINQGIEWFDTTYQPERVRLGKIIEETGRRKEVKVIAWNFFSDFKSGEEVGGPDYYRAKHIDIILEQLQMDYVDALVVHPLDNEEENEKQTKLVESWCSKGYVKSLGLWCPKLENYEKYADNNKYSFMVHPFNITTKEFKPIFDMSKRLSWKIFACSPFVRGWELDKLVEKAWEESGESKAKLKDKISDLMLRYSLFEYDIDMLIVGIRKSNWVTKNIDSFKRGKLTIDEKEWLELLAL